MSGRLVAAIDDDALVRREAVHLDEQLVERLLALFVAERVAAAAAADRVELVDEDDAGRVTARVPEQLADARRADARVHLDEVRAAGEQERRFRLAGDRSREQRLAGARRADEQHAFRNPAADGGEALGLAQEIDDLLHLLLRFVDAGHVLEGHGRRFVDPASRVLLSSAGIRPLVTRYSVKPSTPMKPTPSRERAVAVRGLLGRVRTSIRTFFFASSGMNAAVRGHVVGRRHGPHRLARLQLEVQRVAVDDDLGDLAPIEMRAADPKTAPARRHGVRTRSATPTATSSDTATTAIQIVRRDHLRANT